MCVLRCVCVNVNTTDATAGATALLLPAQNSLSTIIIGTQTLQLANGRGAGLAASRGGVWRAGMGVRKLCMSCHLDLARSPNRRKAFWL